MSFIVNWNGQIIEQPAPENFWSNKGGIFRGVRGEITYFPLPMAYNKAITRIGTYIVPKKHENRPDLIAKELYGSEDLWWVIYWASNIIDPFSGPKVNDKISILDITQLKSLLS